MSSVISLFAWAAGLTAPGIQDERAVFIEQQSQAGHLYDTPDNWTADFEAFTGTSLVSGPTVATPPPVPLSPFGLPYASLSSAGIAQSLGLNPRYSAYGAVGDGVTDDSAAILKAMNDAHTAGGGTVVLTAATYAIGSNMVVPSNVTLRGMGRNGVFFKAIGSCTSVLIASLAVTNFELSGVTIDGNNQASCLLLVGGGNDTITIDSCGFKNAVQNSAIQAQGVNLGWAVALGKASGTASKNITFTRNKVGPNVPYYESAILSNCQDSTVEGNIFRDASGSTATTGLALYAYCRNVAVVGNLFSNNTGIDCYIQQSDTITFSSNTFFRNVAGNALGIYNVHGLSGHANNFYDSSGLSTGILFMDVLDPGLATFNGNPVSPNGYAYSKNINLMGCNFNGYRVPVQVYPVPSTSNQVTTCNMQDITVEGQADNIGLYGAQVGGPNAQNLKRITIRLKVKGGSYSGGAGIIVEGNPAITSTTTTASVTGSNGAITKQFVQLTALNSGVQNGQWINISNGGTNEDCYVFAAGTGATVSSGSVGGATPPSGPWVYTIINSANTYPSGSTVGQATGLTTGVFNKGVTDVFLDAGEIVGSSSGNSQGILLFNLSTSPGTVDITNYNMNNAASGTGSKLSLLNALPRRVVNNPGLNPAIGNLTGAPTTSPATATSYQNLTGYPLQVTLTGGTVTAVTVSDPSNGHSVQVASASPCIFTLPPLCYFVVTGSGATAAYMGL